MDFVCSVAFVTGVGSEAGFSTCSHTEVIEVDRSIYIQLLSAMEPKTQFQI